MSNAKLHTKTKEKFMDIIDKAKELGSMIAVSRQMEELKKAEVEVEQDDKSKMLLNDYKLLQIELVRATREKRDASIIESIKERLIAKQKELNDYGTTDRYLRAKSTFDNFMKTINNVIIYSISGEEPCSPSKCSSCGGGCK